MDRTPGLPAGALAWLVAGIIAVAAIALGSCLLAKKANASPVYLAVETGATYFKWNNSAFASGVPDFGSARFDLDVALEWAPRVMEERGFFFVGGFRYQAIGQNAWPRGGGRYTVNDQTFVDGPRIGIRFRARLVP